MVVYEFKCTGCNKIVESTSTIPDKIHCGKSMRRIYGVTGIHFKGPGFYTNDKKRPGT